MKVLAVATLAMMFLLVAGAIARAENPGGISGFVRDETGRPVPFATISLYKRGHFETAKEIVVDRNGFFVDLTIEPGRYDIYAMGGPDGMKGCTNVAVYPDESSRATLRLSAPNTALLHCFSYPLPLVDPSQTADVYRI